MPSIKPIDLDGSVLEGGGQLVRVALSLSAITGIPVHIYNIRANRGRGASRFKHKASKGQPHGRHPNSGSPGAPNSKADGGLKESHLAAVIYLAHQCNAYVEGAEVGSRELVFVPGAGGSGPTSRRKKGQASGDGLVDFETNTIELKNPGSVWLILQALLPWMIFGRSESGKLGKDEHFEIKLKGGTNVSKSMSGDYVQLVLLPMLSRIGLPQIDVSVDERGWAGNAAHIGQVTVGVPRTLDSFNLPPFSITDRGEVEKIMVKIVAHDDHTTDQFVACLKGVIAEHFGGDMAVDVMSAEPSGDPRRVYVLLVACTSNGWRLGRDYLGTGRTPKNEAESRRIIDNACQTVVRELKGEVQRRGCVDEFLQDQLVIFQALADGKTCVDGGAWDDQKLEGDKDCGDDGGSLHTRTVRWVCGKMLRKQGVELEPGGRCRGIGWNKSAEATATVLEKLEKLDIGENR